MDSQRGFRSELTPTRFTVIRTRVFVHSHMGLEIGSFVESLLTLFTLKWSLSSLESAFPYMSANVDLEPSRARVGLPAVWIRANERSLSRMHI